MIDEVMPSSAGFQAAANDYHSRAASSDAISDRLNDVEVKKFRFAYVVTNFHVIEAAVSLEFSFAEGQAAGDCGFLIEVVAELEDRDVAVVKVLAHSFPPGLHLANIEPPIGQSVFALGNPQGLEGSLSSGIVSGYRNFDDLGRVIQTTAAISHGSSGGPLLDKYGEVIGVMTAVVTTGQNLNLAVCADAIEGAFTSGLCKRSVFKGRSAQKELTSYLIDKQVRCNATTNELDVIETGGARTEIKEDDESVRTAKKHLAQAIEAQIASNWDDARRYARQAEPQLPDSLKPAAWIVDAIASFTIAHAEAESEVLPARPNSTKEDLERFHSLLKLKDGYERSIGLLRRSIRALPDAGYLHAQLAFQYGQAGENLDQKNSLDSAIQYCKYDTRLYWSRGATYMGLESYQLAEADFRKAIELNSRSGDNFSWLARALTSQKRYDEAMTAAVQALELGSDDDVRPMIMEMQRLNQPR
ncbi:MAG: trypsin-like peptidase domain-containing protein [Pirellulales bacterium]